MERRKLNRKIFASYLALLLTFSAIMASPLASSSTDNSSTPSTIVIYPSDDTTIEANHPDATPGSNEFLAIRNDYGEGGSSGWEWSALIKFDLSSIPPGTTIESAELRLYYHHWWDNDPGGRELKLYRIIDDWDESTTNWNNFPGTVSEASSSSIVPYSTNTWVVWDVTEDVQKFINGEFPNYGWKIADENYWGDINIPITYLCSKEYNDDEYIPRLVITVVVGNKPPVADFTWMPEHPGPNEEVTFDASDSYDPDGMIVSYEWDWNNDGVYDEIHDNPRATHSWSSEGVYLITLRVTDNRGATDTATKPVHVKENDPPVAKIYSVIPNPAEIGETISFKGSVTDPDNDRIVEYVWCSNKDGRISNKKDFDKSDLSEGLHLISFRARDERGAWSDWQFEEVKVVDGMVYRPTGAPGKHHFSISEDKKLNSGWGSHKEDSHADMTDGAVAVAADAGILGSSSATARLGLTYFYEYGGKKTFRVSSNLLSVGGKTGWASTRLMLHYQRGTYQYWSPGSYTPIDELFDWDLIIDLFIFYAGLLCPPTWAGLIANCFLNIVGAWRTIQGYQKLYETMKNAEYNGEQYTEEHRVVFEQDVLPYFSNHFYVELQADAGAFIMGGKAARAGQIPYICMEEVKVPQHIPLTERFKSVQYCSLHAEGITVYGYGPVTITITDPAGRLLNETYSEIPGSLYTGYDFNYDGCEDSYFFIPNAINGTYNISVTPKDWADANAKFSIIVNYKQNNTVLVENETISNITNSSSYYYDVISTNPPFIQLKYPTGYEILRGTVTVEWIATDYEDGHNLPISLYYSDDGEHWSIIDSNLENTGKYSWNTTDIPDGGYVLMIVTNDSDGNLRYDLSEEFIVHNYNRPVASFDYTLSNNTNRHLIQFISFSNDSDGVIVNWTWNFGDGCISYEKNPIHEYASEGTYNVSLTVRDNDGLVDTVSKSIYIGPLSVSIIKPRGHLYIGDREIIPLPDNITIILGPITIEVTAESTMEIEKVEFYIDDELKANDTTAPYLCTWSEKSFGKHRLKIVVYDNAGNQATSEIVVWKFF